MKKTLEQKLLEAEEWFKKHPSVYVASGEKHAPLERVFPAEEALKVLREQERTLRRLERKLRLIRRAYKLFLFIRENAPDTIVEIVSVTPYAYFKLRGKDYNYGIDGFAESPARPTGENFKRVIRELEYLVEKQKDAIQAQKAWINKLLK